MRLIKLKAISLEMQTNAMHISYATAYSNALFLIQFQPKINRALGIIFATFGLISEPVTWYDEIKQSC